MQVQEIMFEKNKQDLKSIRHVLFSECLRLLLQSKLIGSLQIIVRAQRATDEDLYKKNV